MLNAFTNNSGRDTKLDADACALFSIYAGQLRCSRTICCAQDRDLRRSMVCKVYWILSNMETVFH